MAEPAIPEMRPPEDAGIADHVRVLAASVAAYFQARLELAGLESREAFAHYLVLLLWLAAGCILLVFGYLFAGAALVFLAARFFNVHWAWLMLGFGTLHVLGALACALTVRKKLPKPVFGATLNEFKKDQEWLTTSAKRN